ncbi:MAG: hypothetical protein KJT03_23165, partial [Verrucomicrobiae bacterium]|nr:hypothetical protein [Verrucomicrobiae bacterium]
MLKKIISGGQTGADRAALDAALITGFPCGGFCPGKRQAEDGPIDLKYPLIEIKGGYPERTEKNVLSSDGTLIVFRTELKGGTLLTYELCRSHGKPHQLVDMITFSATEAARLLWDFLENNKIAIL